MTNYFLPILLLIFFIGFEKGGREKDWYLLILWINYWKLKRGTDTHTYTDTQTDRYTNKRRGVARFLHWAWATTYILLTNSSEEFDLWEIQKKYSELLDNYYRVVRIIYAFEFAFISKFFWYVVFYIKIN